jgi:hypothetical protein
MFPDSSTIALNTSLFLLRFLKVHLHLKYAEILKQSKFTKGYSDYDDVDDVDFLVGDLQKVDFSQ